MQLPAVQAITEQLHQVHMQLNAAAGDPELKEYLICEKLKPLLGKALQICEQMKMLMRMAR